MERARKVWNGSDEQAYQPLIGGDRRDDTETTLPETTQPPFSYIDYGIFMLLGVSMLWAWNMMLAAGPYFQTRFRDDQRILENFQAAEISVSTTTTLISMTILTKVQANASYPKRIIVSLFINMIVFSLMAASTSVKTSAGAYFGFLIAMIFSTSMATALCQNGIFAFATGFGRPEYIQGVVTGQAVAGVLPCIIQIVSVLPVLKARQMEAELPPSDHIESPEIDTPVPPRSAMGFFLTATGIAVVTVFAFVFLLVRQHRRQQARGIVDDGSSDTSGERKSVSLRYLFRKLFWLASAVFLTLAITMTFPIYTQRIVSVRPSDDQPPFLQPPSFIPLAFLFWNVGDLAGRLLTAFPSLSLTRFPRLVLLLAVSRIAFVGMYHLCNIDGMGAVISSDIFYLVVVQLLFGLSNGFVSATCMIGAREWVEPDERETTGAFMSLCLVGGLTVGSLISFAAAST